MYLLTRSIVIYQVVYDCVQAAFGKTRLGSSESAKSVGFKVLTWIVLLHLSEERKTRISKYFI